MPDFLFEPIVMLLVLVAFCRIVYRIVYNYRPGRRKSWRKAGYVGYRAKHW